MFPAPLASQRSPSGALLLVAVLCANPVLAVLVGASPWWAIAVTAAVVLALHACWRTWGRRLPTVYAVNFVVLGGLWLHAEALVRGRFHDYVMEDLYLQHGDYYFNRPGLQTRLRDKEYTVDYLTNRDGYRIGATQDPERSVASVDWLFVGDSYTQGAQVPFEALYTSRLYERFPDRIVLNAGVSGWGLYESLAFLRARGRTLRPRTVFVQIANFNDFMKVAPRRAGLSDYLMQESEVVRLLLQDIKYQNPTNLPLGRWVEPFYPTDDENRRFNVFYTRDAREKTRDLAGVRTVLAELHTLCRGLGAQLVLVVIPTKEQVSATYLDEAVTGLHLDRRLLDMTRPNRLVKAVADSLGVPVIDPLAAWRESPVFPFFRYDEHLSADGHEMLAEAIARYLTLAGESSAVRLRSRGAYGDRYPQFYPTGDTLLFHSPRDGNSEIVRADTATWTEQLLTQDDVPETHPILLPGDGLVFVAGDADAGTTRLWRSDRDARRAVELEPRRREFASIPAAFPDGTSLVFPAWGPSPDAPRTRLVRLWLRDGRREVLPQVADQVWRPAVHPSGRYIAYIGRVHGQYDLFELDLVTRQTSRLTDTPFDEWDPTYTPDGRSLVYAARAEGNWDLFRAARGTPAQGTRPVFLTRTRGDEWDPQVSPDGRLLAYGGEFGLMRGIYTVPFGP